MLVLCPKCRQEIRLVDVHSGERVIRYLCRGCESIVHLDLNQDVVPTTSSADSGCTVVRRKTVLVADDAEPVLKLAKALLEDAGYNVLLAPDGAQALKLIRQWRPDLVLLDLLLPRMTGFEVLREIRRDDRIKDTPVVAMSGVYKDKILAFLRRQKAQGFLDKGQIRDQLVFRAQRVLTSP